MATYYCRHGETNNGDGTTSAAAASGGGVGAFNNALACLDGTQAGIADGDTIYFKVGAGVTLTLVAALTIAGAANGGSLRSYIFDNGTVWPGDAGTFIVDCTSYDVTIKKGACLYGHGTDFKFQFLSNLSTGRKISPEISNTTMPTLDGICFKTTNSGSFPYITLDQVFSGDARHGALRWEIYKLSNNNGHETTLGQSGKGHQRIKHLEIWYDPAGPTANSTSTSFSSYYVMKGGSSVEGQHYEIGTLILENPPNVIGLVSKMENGSHFQVSRFITNNVDYEFSTNSLAMTKLSGIKVNGVGNYDFIESNLGIRTTWRVGKNYPTLNSLLPDGVTKWSLKVELPSSLVRDQVREITAVNKYYDQASGVKTFTIETLLYDQFTSPRADRFWCVFSYEDTTGVIRCESTFVDGSLPTSSAAWDTTGYGPANFNKYKFELTTKYAVGSNTNIIATIFMAEAAPDASSFFFVDPEVSVT